MTNISEEAENQFIALMNVIYCAKTWRLVNNELLPREDTNCNDRSYKPRATTTSYSIEVRDWKVDPEKIIEDLSFVSIPLSINSTLFSYNIQKCTQDNIDTYKKLLQ